MRLWHFTSVRHLPLIEAAGFLKVSETNLHPVVEHHGPDAVWFLDGPDLGDARHGLNAAPPGWVVPDKTEVRIEVEVPDGWVRAWLPWAEAQGIDRGWLHALTSEDGGRAAAERWRVVFRPVRRDRWVEVCVRQSDGAWEAKG